MAAKEIAVKKYVVKLSSEERERLETLIRSGKHPARKLNRARILLKADASDAGAAWSDSQIAAALDTANLFMLFAPLEGWRHGEVTDRHTALDYAQILKDLSDTHFPKVTTIVLVQDNLNTHKPASLYEAFPAAEARRLVERFEWHYTPKHGSCLDLADSELGVLSSQCLDRRIPNKQTLTEEVAAWESDRNKHHAKADWQFTTADARIKLKRLYPVL